MPNTLTRTLIFGLIVWAVHVYVDQQAVRESVRADQALDPVQRQLATAGPGRAYFLRRKLDDDLAAKTAQVTEESRRWAKVVARAARNEKTAKAIADALKQGGSKLFRAANHVCLT